MRINLISYPINHRVNASPLQEINAYRNRNKGDKAENLEKAIAHYDNALLISREAEPPVANCERSQLKVTSAIISVHCRLKKTKQKAPALTQKPFNLKFSF
ncbi:MAG TPA: hypothetical protein DEP38_25040 [Cyanobacteria bacterium UBA9226]|nr:hypothetical protein [Cyanobacteria bacterium UBA9226]